jgi:Ubiquitin carboxyl-terminal hydrolase
VLSKLPNMLIIHLQRIVFDFDTLMNQKLNSRVEFPNVLNLKPYMLNEVMKQEKDLLKKTKSQKKQEKQKQREVEKSAEKVDLEEGKDESSSA